MHVEAWGLNHSLYLPYVMHGRPSVAASFSLRPQDSLWDGAHDARLTGDVVDEILGGKVDRADWSVAPDDPGTGARPRHKLSLPYPAFSSCPFAQVDEDDATRISLRTSRACAQSPQDVRGDLLWVCLACCEDLGEYDAGLVYEN